MLHTLAKLEKEGFEVTYLDVRKGHNVTAQQVKDAIRPDTCLVTTMYANNEIGSILPIAEIGAVCKEAGVPFHTDAVQAVGHLHINVKEQNIDMLSLSGHKFHGPKGVGALYVRRGFPLVNIIEGGAQERGKRAGTENIPGICGMAAALKEACDHMDENMPRVAAMRDRLIEGLSKIPHSALNGDPVNRLPGNVSFCFEGIEGESLLLLLHLRQSGPQPRAAGHRPGTRRCPRLIAAVSQRVQHRRGDRPHSEGRPRGRSVSAEHEPRVAGSADRQTAVYSVIVPAKN